MIKKRRSHSWFSFNTWKKNKLYLFFLLFLYIWLMSLNGIWWCCNLMIYQAKIMWQIKTSNLMHGFHFAFVTKEKVIEYKSVTTIAHMSIIAFYFHLYHTYYIVLYTWHRLKLYGVLTFMKNIRHHNLFLIPFLVTIRFSATIF